MEEGRLSLLSLLTVFRLLSATKAAHPRLHRLHRLCWNHIRSVSHWTSTTVLRIVAHMWVHPSFPSF